MRYKVVLSRSARRNYSLVDADMAKRLNNVFDALESNPYPKASKSLKGELEGFSRIRVAHLRIIYQIIESACEIRIVKIGPRGDIY